MSHSGTVIELRHIETIVSSSIALYLSKITFVCAQISLTTALGSSDNSHLLRRRTGDNLVVDWPAVTPKNPGSLASCGAPCWHTLFADKWSFQTIVMGKQLFPYTHLPNYSPIQKMSFSISVL